MKQVQPPAGYETVTEGVVKEGFLMWHPVVKKWHPAVSTLKMSLDKLRKFQFVKPTERRETP